MRSGPVPAEPGLKNVRNTKWVRGGVAPAQKPYTRPARRAFSIFRTLYSSLIYYTFMVAPLARHFPLPEALVKKYLPKIILYIAVLLVVFTALLQFTTPALHTAAPLEGRVDLTALDLSGQLASIPAENWEYYPGRLYAPEDFAAGNTDAPLYENAASLSNYGTYRLFLKLPPGEIYTVTGRSFHFSQRVYIDGVLAGEVGSPGETRETTTPRTETFDYTFAAQGGSTEIIFQAASFYHRQGAQNSPLVLARPQVVGRYRALEMIRTNIVVGCLLTVFFYFAGMFIFFSRRAYFLYLGLAALSIALRITMIGEKHIMEFFPNLSWFVAIRAEYICQVLFVVFLTLYFARLYPNMLHKAYVASAVTFLLLFCGFVLVADTLLFTRAIVLFQLAWAVCSAYTLYKLARQLRGGGIHTVLIFIGFMVFVFTAGYDEIAYLLLKVRPHNTLVTGVLVCMFTNMIALTLDFSQMEGALAEAEQKQRELDETNRLLDRLNDMKTYFLSNISHEMKTPLTVMSANAQLTKTLVETGAGQDEIFHNLDTVSREAERLARMVNSMLDLSSTQETHAEMEQLDITPLLRASADVYRSLLEKNGNRLEVDLAPKLPVVSGDADMLTQVVLNLLANANHHTRGGKVALSSRVEEDGVRVTVADTGEGIAADVLPHVFERHVSDQSDGGSGLGLAICRSIIEKHGGHIQLESAKGRGTTVCFYLPTAKEAGGA